MDYTKTCCLVIAVMSALPVMSEESAIPGNPDTRLFENNVYYLKRAHILPAMSVYVIWRGSHATSDMAGTGDLPKVTREQAKENLLAAIKQYPDEVNDASGCCGGFSSILETAVWCNDLDVVKALLDAGAIPFSMKGSEDILDVKKPLKGDVLDPEIIKVVKEAQGKYNLLEIIIQAKKAGFELKLSNRELGDMRP
jgi:hypothetical protein